MLIVEDSDDDAALVVRALQRAGYEVTHQQVQTREDMAAALEHQAWDVIVSDYSMPAFDAPGALSVLREHGRDIPFIIVSGTVGEDTAVEAMRLGAHDYLLKGKLTRLPPAIERELRDSAARRAHREAERALRVSEPVSGDSARPGSSVSSFRINRVASSRRTTPSSASRGTVGRTW